MKRQLVNVMTYPSKKGQKLLLSEKIQDDSGNITKKITEIKEPKISFYITKPEYTLNTNINFIEADKVNKITVPYNTFIQSLFELTGHTQEEYDVLKANNRQALRNIHQDKNLHQTDLYYDDYIIRQYLNRYKNELYPFSLDKAYTDIETDISNYFKFPDPNIAPCPICLLSYLYAPAKTIYGFILNNPNNKSQQDFLNNIYSEKWTKKILKEYFSDKPETTLNKLELRVFDNELDLIKDYFKLLHKDRPDFNSGWNFYFDVKTIYKRLEQLLPDNKLPESIMCDPTISAPNVYLVEDTFNTKEYDKKDKLNIAGYTQYVDMKFTYAAVRKGTGEKDSYSLEAITDEELGEGKIELSGDIRTTLNKDFENFLIYSLVDSYRLFQLEEKNKDIDLLFKVGQVTFTKFERTLTKTICLRNLFIDVLEKNGYILSNNKNSNNSYAEKVKFKGA
jgi:hypothetical protein